MLTGLDSILFPDNCEVVEIPLHNQWVYLIQKNGSSSLRKQLDEDDLTLFVNQQVYELDCVDVYIRDSKERYVSGVNTYLQHLKRDHPELDQSTAFWFVKQYQFLNRHYLPQFHWLVNLSRFIAPDTKIRLRNFRDINLITDYNKTAGITPYTIDFREHLINNNPSMDLWFFADQILLDLAGKELSWKQILEHYQIKHSSTFNTMCDQLKQIANCVLS